MIGTLLEKLFVSVGVDLSGFGSELSKASAEVDRLSADLRRDFAAVGKSWQATGQKMVQTGAVMTGAITVPLVLFGKQATKAAIDAEEMQSAFNVVFGKMAGDMDKWAEATGNAMGRSTQEMQRGALAFQELFGKALAPEKAAEMSKQFAVLTQDLASFKNLSNEVAQQKLFSGLTGEAEPLRAVGVFLNEDAVKAKALAMGLAGANGKLTDQQKILARAAIIREQLAQADGDVMRTSDSTANRIRASQSAFEELSITVGTTLIPAITPLINVVAGLLEGFNKLDPNVQTFIVGAAAAAAALGPIVSIAGTLVSGFGALMPAIGGAIPVIGGMAGSFVGLLAAAGPILPIIAAVAAAGALIYANWDEIAPVLQEFWKTVSTALGPPLKELITTVIAAFTELWNGPLGEGIRTVVGAFLQFQAAYAKAFGSAFVVVLKAAIAVLTVVFQQIGDGIRLVNALIKGDWSKVWELATAIMKRSLLGIPELIGKMVIGIRDWVVGKLGAIWDSVAKKIDWIKARFFDLYDAVVGHSYVPDMVDRIGEEMAKLQTLMVEPAVKSTKATKEAFRDLARDVSGIMDEVFPDQAAIRDLNAKIATVNKAEAAKQISPDAAGATRSALEAQLAEVRARAAGPGQNVSDLVSRLLPDQSAIKQIRADMVTLDNAISAGKGNMEELKAARAALDLEMAKASEWPLTNDLRNLTEALYPASAEITRIGEDMRLLNAAFAAHEIDPAMYEDAMAKLDEAMDAAEVALERSANMQTEWGRLVEGAKDFGNDLGQSVMGGLREWLTGKKSLGDALRDGLSHVLENAISQSLRNLEVSIFGKDGLGGFLGNALGSLFGGGARAVGGPVLPGRAYDVGTGEKFVPSAHGRILSRNDAMRAIGGGQQMIRQGDVHIHVSGPMSDREARRTGLQAGRAARLELSKNARIMPA